MKIFANDIVQHCNLQDIFKALLTFFIIEDTSLKLERSQNRKELQKHISIFEIEFNQKIV